MRIIVMVIMMYAISEAGVPTEAKAKHAGDAGITLGHGTVLTPFSVHWTQHGISEWIDAWTASAIRVWRG